jgi:hypothetical protein
MRTASLETARLDYRWEEGEMNAYPEGYGPESAYYAVDGAPRDQAVPELQRIEAVAGAHGTIEAEMLAHEASVYLAWLADHESCADMPEDWEPVHECLDLLDCAALRS